MINKLSLFQAIQKCWYIPFIIQQYKKCLYCKNTNKALGILPQHFISRLKQTLEIPLEYVERCDK